MSIETPNDNEADTETARSGRNWALTVPGSRPIVLDGRNQRLIRGAVLRESIITLERDGKKYTANYAVSGGIVTVTRSGGQKSTQQGGLPADRVAHMLLSELVSEGKA